MGRKSNGTPSWSTRPNLNAQGRRAQAECLRRAGYAEDAKNVEKGLVEFDPDALENLTRGG